MIELPPQTSWVRLLHPTLIHLEERVETEDGTEQTRERIASVTPALLAELASETTRLFEAYDKLAQTRGTTPYRPPILVEHEATGTRVGEIREVKLVGDELYALAKWCDAAWQDVQTGKIAHVSAGYDYEYLLHDGTRFGAVLREFSITATPVLKTIGTIQDTLALRLSERLTTQGHHVDAEKIEEILGALASQAEKIATLEAGYQDLLARLTALESPAAETASYEEEPEEEMTEEPSGASAGTGLDPEELSERIVARVTERLGERFSRLNLAHPPAGAPRASEPKTREQLAAQLKAKGLKGERFAQQYSAEVKRLKLK